MKILDGKLLAKNLNEELSKKILLYKNDYGRSPHLLVILVGDNPASKVYVINCLLYTSPSPRDS